MLSKKLGEVWCLSPGIADTMQGQALLASFSAGALNVGTSLG